MGADSFHLVSLSCNRLLFLLSLLYTQSNNGKEKSKFTYVDSAEFRHITVYLLTSNAQTVFRNARKSVYLYTLCEIDHVRLVLIATVCPYACMKSTLAALRSVVSALLIQGSGAFLLSTVWRAAFHRASLRIQHVV